MQKDGFCIYISKQKIKRINEATTKAALYVLKL